MFDDLPARDRMCCQLLFDEMAKARDGSLVPSEAVALTLLYAIERISNGSMVYHEGSLTSLSS